MGVMNVVAQGFVQCCKRQLGCVSFFENTKIIKKVELLLLSRNRCTTESLFHCSPSAFPPSYTGQLRF
jgi:hypothetical protein